MIHRFTRLWTNKAIKAYFTGKREKGYEFMTMKW